jgi:hypothetical protein
MKLTIAGLTAGGLLLTAWLVTTAWVTVLGTGSCSDATAFLGVAVPARASVSDCATETWQFQDVQMTLRMSPADLSTWATQSLGLPESELSRTGCADLDFGEIPDGWKLGAVHDLRCSSQSLPAASNSGRATRIVLFVDYDHSGLRIVHLWAANDV